MISVCFQGKPLNIIAIQVYAPTANAEEAEFNRFYEDPQDLLELIQKKRHTFCPRGLECKIGGQEIPGVAGKFDLGVQNETGQRLTVLSREHIGYSKCSFPTTQERTLHRNITRWSI